MTEFVDSSLGDHAAKAAEAEMELAVLAAEIELRQAVSTICKYPEWPQFASRLETLRHKITEKIMHSRMDPYELGKRQGMASAITSILTTAQPTTQDIDEQRQRITMLEQNLEGFRKLLE